MKVSVTEFYQDVFGKKPASGARATANLRALGMELPAYKSRAKVADIALLAEVKAKQAQIEADRKEAALQAAAKKLERKARRGNGPAQEDLFQHRGKGTSPYYGVMDALNTHGLALGRIESMVNRIVRDLGVKT